MDPKLLYTLLGGGGGAVIGGAAGNLLSNKVEGDEDETEIDRKKRIRDATVIGTLLGGLSGAAVPASSMLFSGSKPPKTNLPEHLINAGIWTGTNVALPAAAARAWMGGPVTPAGILSWAGKVTRDAKGTPIPDEPQMAAIKRYITEVIKPIRQSGQPLHFRDRLNAYKKGGQGWINYDAVRKLFKGIAPLNTEWKPGTPAVSATADKWVNIRGARNWMRKIPGKPAVPAVPPSRLPITQLERFGYPSKIPTKGTYPGAIGMGILAWVIQNHAKKHILPVLSGPFSNLLGRGEQ